MVQALNGRRVKVLGGFDFIKHEALAATVAQAGDRALLLRLEAPLTYLGRQFEHVVAQVRHGDERFDALLAQGQVDCHCLWVPVERFDPAHPLEVGWWRGADQVLSTLTLAGVEGLAKRPGSLLASQR
jgi:hypothetical protein